MPGAMVCMRVGDRRPVLRMKLSLKGDPGTNPLTGALGVRFRMIRKSTGGRKIDDAVATIDSISERTVSYAWAAGDTNESGKFSGLFVVDYGGGIVQTFASCESDEIVICFE